MLMLSSYRIVEILHQRHHVVIYRGTKIEDPRQSVIIKVPTTTLPNSKGAEKLRHEFEIGQRITSKYVVKYKELLPHALYGYILIEEDDQAQALVNYIPKTGLEPLDFLQIALPLAEGLRDIHRSNTVHKDIKPSNIIVQLKTGLVKYIDFSSASLLHQCKQVTINPSVSEGTLAYISPEQTGRINRLLDYRTDFYSLGITFYQLLCGKLPFTGKSALELIHCHIAELAIPPHEVKPTIPALLSDIIMKLLQKDPEKRYQSAHGLFKDLTICFNQLREKENIVPFILAQHDIPEYFYLVQKLYGREPELAFLKKTFDRTRLGQPELCMVIGAAGAGKSMLVNEMRAYISLNKGYFLAGKFEQLHRTIAYSAISQAFKSWIKTLLIYDETEILEWRKQLLIALNNNGQLIIDVIPDLELIIGKQPPVSTVDAEQTKNRFQLTFQNFINVLAQPTHPLVLFLDDWQWADAASLALLEAIITNPDTRYLFCIGAYRDNEVTTSHPALLTLEAIQKANIKVHNITLSALDLTHVNQWIAETLRFSPKVTYPLAQLIYQKTAGNPFFIKTFIQILYEQQFMRLTEDGWQWDLEKICQLSATQNVVECMAHHISQLPVTTQEILKVASCLGHRFTLPALQLITQEAEKSLLVELRAVTESNLLLQTEDYFQFAHDRIQEAAYGLISIEKRAAMHFSIGRLLQTKLPAEPSPEQLSEVVDHLNQSKALIIDQNAWLELVQLNLKAAHKAKAAAAYATALSYLQAAESYIAAISSDLFWQEHYRLAYDLYKTLAEIECLNGHFDASASYIDLLLKRAQTTLEKMDIYILNIVQKTVACHYEEAINIGYQALHLLGIDLQSQDLQFLLQRESTQAKENLKNRTMQELLDAPLMTDVNIKALVKLLNNLGTSAYLGNPPLHAVIVMMIANSTLQYGNTEESSFGYSGYANILISRLNEIQLGYDFGLLAIQLSDKFHDLTNQCRTSFTHGLLHRSWRKPLSEAEVYFDRAQQAGLKAGDFQYLGYLLPAKLIHFFYQGIPLSTIEAELKKQLKIPYVRANRLAIGMLHALQLVILNLKAQTPEETIFQDTVKTDVEYQINWQQEQNFFVLVDYLILKAQALYLHGQFEKALTVLLASKNSLTSIACSYPVAAHNFYYSLILTALYSTVDNDTKHSYWQQLEANQTQMKAWANHCPENFLHKYLLVAAEMAYIQGHKWEAIEQYDKAIQLAQEQGFIQEQALANELGAKFWLKQSKPSYAQGLLQAANQLYERWGAKHKVDQLMVQHRELLKPLASANLSSFSISEEEETISANSLCHLDLSSILKTSQAISSEVDLNKLLVKIMNLLIENAGAQKGTFLLEKSNTWLVQAEYTIKGKIRTLQQLPLFQWKNGAHSIIEYVKRTQQSVLLGNANTDSQYSQDPYISNHHIQSVLCLPIIRQHQLKGILYIENNLAPYVFTEQHLQTLTILSSQIAISLENATSYESIRSVTEQLNLALQSGNVGIWSWDIQTDKISWDERLYELFGIKKENFDHTYEGFMALMHLEDRTRVKRAIKQTLEESVFFNEEYRIIKPDKSIHIMASQGKIYRDDKGRVEQILGIIWDITQQKRLEEERFQALKQAEEKERQRAQEAENARKELEQSRELERFIDTLCHELRNPLQGIYGNISLLENAITQIENSTPDKNIINEQISQAKESIAAIDKCAKHQKQITDDVLNLSKLKAKKIELRQEEFDPKQLIRSAMQMLEGEINRKRIKLCANLTEANMVMIGDPYRLTQIIVNLLSNATKFTPENGNITIHLYQPECIENDVILKMAIEDTGIGMSKEEQAALFNRFTQANLRTSEEYGGSGLGLSIVKDLLELMRGGIKVESEKGRGTKFIFTAKCQKAVIALSKQLEEKEKLSAVSSEPAASLYILIVEDNIINQKILMKQLEQAGHRYCVANNGQVALEMFDKDTFDIILMDVEMPVMNGLEATKAIREKEKLEEKLSIPIIALSANARQEKIDEVIQNGMSDYLVKPFNKTQLLEKIDTIMQKQIELRLQYEKTKNAKLDKNSLEISTDYWYEDSEMRRILEFQIAQHHNQTLEKKPIYMLGPLDNISPYGLIEALTEHNRKTGVVLVPFNIGQLHWVGLIIEFNIDGKLIRADYYDSAGNNAPLFLNRILQMMDKKEDTVTEFNSIRETIKLISQTNASDCGPCTIANLLAGIGYKEKETAVFERRLKHIQLLELAGDKEFFNAFYERQRLNRSSFANIRKNEKIKSANKLSESSHFNISEYRELLSLALGILKLPRNIQENLKKALQPVGECEDEHALQLAQIRASLNEYLYDQVVRLVIKKIFYLERNPSSLEDAILKLDYNQLLSLSILLSLSEEQIAADLHEMNSFYMTEAHKIQAIPNQELNAFKTNEKSALTSHFFRHSSTKACFNKNDEEGERTLAP